MKRTRIKFTEMIRERENSERQKVTTSVMRFSNSSSQFFLAIAIPMSEQMIAPFITLQYLFLTLRKE